LVIIQADGNGTVGSLSDTININNKIYSEVALTTSDICNRLLKDIERNGSGGIGKSEPLKYRKGWSKRIDSVNRLVYNIHDDMIEIIQCKGHYED
jgi:toxin YoeB